MKKTVAKILFAVIILTLALGMIACNAGVNGTYYKYVDGVKVDDDWIKLEKKKWSDSSGASGRLETNDGTVYGYCEIFGEEDVMFWGTVSDGVLKYTIGEKSPITNDYVYYNYYTEKSKADNKNSAPYVDEEDNQGGNQGNTGDNNQGGSGGNNEDNNGTTEEPVTERTVSFNTRGGKELDSITCTVGEVMTLPTPIKDKHRFVGWEDYSGHNYDNTSVMPDKNLTLYAKWEEIVTKFSDDYITFKQAAEGKKHGELMYYDKYANSGVQTFLYVEFTSDELGGVDRVGKQNNLDLATEDKLDYSLKSGYNLTWYEGNFNTPNGAQLFTLNYGSNIQLLTITKDERVIKRYLVDFYVRYDYYVSLYTSIYADEPYTNVRVIENERFPSDTAVKSVANFEYKERVYYNTDLEQYVTYNYDTVINKDMELYQTYKPEKITVELNGGTLSESVSVTPYTKKQTYPTPTHDGYDFIGWKLSDGTYFTDLNGFAASQMLCADNNFDKLTADFRAKKFKKVASGSGAQKTVAFVKTVPVVVFTDSTQTSIHDIEYVLYDEEKNIVPTSIYYPNNSNQIFYQYNRYDEDGVSVKFDNRMKAIEGVAVFPTLRDVYEIPNVNINTYAVRLNTAQTFNKNESSCYLRPFLATSKPYKIKVTTNGSLMLRVEKFGEQEQRTFTINSENPASFTMQTIDAEASWATLYVYDCRGSFTVEFTGATVDYETGDAGLADEENSVAVGDEVTINATTDAGYTWLGWYDGNTKVSEEASFTFEMPIIEKLYTAKWAEYFIRINSNNEEAGTYSMRYGQSRVSVNFDMNGASEIENITQNIDETTALVYPDIQTREGYLFGGWYTSADCTGTAYDFTAELNQDITLYAKWVAYDGYGTLTFGNSISLDVVSKDSSTIRYYAFVPLVSETITLYTTGNLDTYGYLYNGNKEQLTYNDDGGSGHNFSISYSVSAGILYYLRPCGYDSSGTTTLNFTATQKPQDGGKIGNVTIVDGRIAVGQEVSLSAKTNNGYTWLGWYDGNEKVSEGADLIYIFTMTAANKTYTAKWIECPVTLKKNIADAGTVSGVEGATAVGTETTITATTNVGYTWIGWYDEDDNKISEGDSLSATIIMQAAKTFYTAKWYYPIAKNIEEAGTITKLNENYAVGDSVTVNATTNNGYTWLGWYDGDTKVSEGTSQEFTFEIPAEQKTYIAKWYKAVEKNIDSAGAVSGIESTYVVGDEVTVTATTNIGYIWQGWYNNDTLITTELSYTFTMPENSIVYTAKWEQCSEHDLDENCVCTLCGATAHTPNDNCVCEKCGATAHTPNENCLCEKCGATAHTPNENCLCEKCGKTVHAVKEKGAYCRHGNDIYFGTYPQTLVRDSALSTALGSYNDNTWTSYGYYKNGSVSNYMFYTDKEYNGEKYRGVYFTEKRPYFTAGSYIGEAPNYWIYDYVSSSNYKTFNTSTVYWFKYEPIKWTVVKEESGLATLVADLILDSQNYYINSNSSTRSDYQGNSANAYANNYQYSTIRTWLNVTFYETAFNELQKSLIETTNVDNSVSSTGYSGNSYVCQNTNDKVFLLSYKEANTYFTRDSARRKKSTDYAKSQGLWVSTDSSYLGNSYWWLRSPYNSHSYCARGVRYDGSLYYYNYYVYYTYYGVVPALVIRL